MAIEYYRKNVYGTDYYYLKDREKASLWLALTGKKTINASEIHNARKLFKADFKEVLQNHNIFIYD